MVMLICFEHQEYWSVYHFFIGFEHQSSICCANLNGFSCEFCIGLEHKEYLNIGLYIVQI